VNHDLKHATLKAVSELLQAAVDPQAALFVVDAEQRVVHWSDGARELLGFSQEAMQGEHCLKGNRCPQCMAGCGVQEISHIDGSPLVLFAADGRAVAVTKFARALRSPDGDFLGAVELLLPRATRTEAPEDRVTFHGMTTADAGMKQIFRMLLNVAETEAPVLLRGESGTGKELAARAVHAESHRRDGPFLAVNCAALSPALLESELFGHVRGAFTGAVRARDGLFRRARGGTLFLDEVAELPLDLQAKLLRVLQEAEVTPVGASMPIKVNVRVLSATHASLRARVAEGRFREDLMYRLRVVPLFLPPLRLRRVDILPLFWHFVDEENSKGIRRIQRVAPDAMRALLDHRWPGNIRELMNVVRYAFAVGRGPELMLDELTPELREPHNRRTGSEADRIRAALTESGGNIGEAARMLGVSRATFWRKRKKHGL